MYLGDKMNKFKTAVLRFMSGRYGNDNLNNFIFFVSILLYIIHRTLLRNLVIGVLSQLLLIVVIWRMFSKNWYKRQLENNKYLMISKPIRLRCVCLARQLKDRDRRYYVCPKCSQIVRVPKGRGKIEIDCPKCHHSFEKRT